MTDSQKRIVEALWKSQAEAEIAAETRALVEKQQAIIRAEDAIYSAIARWIGKEMKRGERIPIVRGGRVVGEMPENLFLGNPVAKIAGASLIEHKAEIDRKISVLQKVEEAAQALSNALGAMTNMDLAQLTIRGNPTGINALSGQVASLAERIVREIGIVTSASISASALRKSASEQVGELQGQLAQRKAGIGRPRNEAAYAVARELAVLYAKVTGKMPTYSEGPDGLSGEYTPALREVFDALGWEKLSLKTRAQSTIRAVSESDLQYDETPLGGLLSAVSRE